MTKPNILLIVLDTARAKNMSLYGHENRTTPFLEAFAEDATFFTQARSAAKWSVPSHASIFSGYHVVEHGMTDDNWRMRPGNTIFGELSDEHGYDTALYSYNGYVNGRAGTGFDADFDTKAEELKPPFPGGLDPGPYRDQARQFVRDSLSHDQPIRSLLNGALVKVGWDHPDLLPEFLLEKTTAGYTSDDRYVEQFLDWHRSRDGPWAACVNLMRIHHPYDPAPAYDRWDDGTGKRVMEETKYWNWDYLGGMRPWSDLRKVLPYYDGAIRHTDEDIRTIVEALKRRGDYEDTMIVVTGDHGEGFGERSNVRDDLRISAHIAGSHEVLFHVPLLVKYPAQTRGVEQTHVASLTQFPSAVRSVLANDWEAGQEFVPEEGYAIASEHGVRSVDDEKVEKYCADYRDDFYGDAYVVYENIDGGGVKKMMNWRDRSVTLEVPNAQEARVLDEDNRDVVEAAFADIERRDVAEQTDQELDEATKEHLEALGYR